MVEVRWTSEAVKDIEDIAEFVGKYAEKYAQFLVRTFFDSIAQLEHFPLSGRIVPEFNDKKLRELIIYDYRIVHFIKTESQIDVIAVHPAKKPMKQLRKNLE